MHTAPPLLTYPKSDKENDWKTVLETADFAVFKLSV